MSTWIKALFVLAFVCLGGCATLAPFTPLAETHAIQASPNSALGRLAGASQAGPDASPDLSGFRLMPTGDYSLDARLELARLSERSLDLQYYQLENDQIGRTVLRAARDAALRGVRVRLLVDDMYTSGEDELFLAFAATPNVEVRLFNPFPAGRFSFAGRLTASLFDFSRVNHRMHNKLFIADEALAVTGGRNLGDHYFATADSDNFVDIDALVAGALVGRLSNLFDMYWNSPYVRPIGTIVTSDLSGEELRTKFELLTGPETTPQLPPPPPNDYLGYEPISDDIKVGRLNLIWAKAEAHADSPDRVIDKKTTYEGVDLIDLDSARYNVIEQIRRARSDVTIMSPYLIPGDAGLEEMGVLRNRGVKITLITNSLASTDEALVYEAYRKYRPAMLRLGVQVWELGAVMSGRSVLNSRVGRLHAKAAVIDGKTLFIGSMNFDPRSATQNTELCVIIHSDELAQQQLKLLESLERRGAYRLKLTSNGYDVEWESHEHGANRVFQADPDTSLWDRILPALLHPLMPESLL